jgi:hypothetical protein
MNFEIVSRREYNLLSGSIKIDKQSRRNEDYYELMKRSLCLLIYNCESTCQDGRCYSNDVYCDAEMELDMMQQYRSVIGSIDRFDNLVKSELILCA